jgi:hypothetical protein
VQRYAEAFSNQLDLYTEKYDEYALLTAASIILRTTNLTFLGFFVIYKWEGSDVSSEELVENKSSVYVRLAIYRLCCFLKVRRRHPGCLISW